MNNIVLSPAKINLILDVGEKKDGYHEIYTIMQTVSFFDTILFSIKKKWKYNENKQIIIKSNKKYLPIDDRNLCFKAAKFFIDNFLIKDQISIYIIKSIPSGGGLGGGSSNFYQVINFLNEYYNKNLNVLEIQNICNKFGSDISYFSIGGTCECTGRGEIIKKIPSFPECFILIVNPNIHSSTKEAYDEYDNSIHFSSIDKRNNFNNELYNNKNLKVLSNNIYNSFESVIFKKYPIIKNIKNDMINNGAINSMMSGSGSSIFGIFNNYKSAKLCKNFIKKKYNYFSIISKPIDKIPNYNIIKKINLFSLFDFNT